MKASSLGPRPRLLGVLLFAAATVSSGCMEMLRSDAANFGRQRAQARAAALVGNRQASHQAAPARMLAGDELTRLLAGRTQVSEYRKSVSDAQPYYAVYAYYGADGRYLWLNTYEQSDPATTPWGTWQVQGEVLCVTQQRGEADPHCYTVRLESGGTVQYWIHRPGDAFHGLITASVDIVREGPQTPAFVSSSTQMR